MEELWFYLSDLGVGVALGSVGVRHMMIINNRLSGYQRGDIALS